MRKIIIALHIVILTAATVIAPETHALSPVHEIVRSQAEKCGLLVADVHHHPEKYASLKKREQALKIVADSVAIFNDLERALSSDKTQVASKEDRQAAALRAQECELSAANAFSRLK